MDAKSRVRTIVNIILKYSSGRAERKTKST